MREHMKTPCLLLTLLDERYYEESPGHPVVCRLWRMRPQASHRGSVCYAVGMESPNRRYLYCVGGDETAARRLLRIAAEERLSPIHLKDVVEDFLWEAEQGRLVAETLS